ncbi:MAG: hypothetical protein NT154_25305 [Verrucomicrobia bacterium]|nr:hypothetical protein [Verrucomicrobiota bacterium]
MTIVTFVVATLSPVHRTNDQPLEGVAVSVTTVLVKYRSSAPCGGGERLMLPPPGVLAASR